MGTTKRLRQHPTSNFSLLLVMSDIDPSLNAKDDRELVKLLTDRLALGLDIQEQLVAENEQLQKEKDILELKLKLQETELQNVKNHVLQTLGVMSEFAEQDLDPVEDIPK